MNLIRLQTVDSTNEYLKKGVFPDGTVVFSDEQTAGKGSNGRSFLSPSGGIYFSILFSEPKREVLPYITPVAAVAVRRALASVFNARPEIKWVNDLYLSGKKICGILCENVSSGVIIGIGVNVSRPKEGFPPELRDIAGYVSEKSPTEEEKLTFVQTVSETFFSLLSLPHSVLAKEYRSHSFVIGKKAVLTRGDETFCGVVKDIDEEFRLILTTEKGDETFFSGTLRLI